MLLRISLIIVILAGLGTIAVTQMQSRKQIQTVITERNDHIKKENEERSGRKKAEQNWAATSNLLNQTKATLATTQDELNNTKQQLAAANANVEKVTGDLRAANEARKTAEQTLSKWDQLHTTPELVLALQANYKNSQELVQALEQEKTILSRALKELQNKYDILVGPENFEPKLPEGTKGKIVAVDPKWNFVVLNIGRDKGLLERGVLLVHRESKLIGKVRISEVMDHRAIANVVPGSLDEPVEGDQVLY